MRKHRTLCVRYILREETVITGIGISTCSIELNFTALEADNSTT